MALDRAAVLERNTALPSKSTFLENGRAVPLTEL
jgi:hypothetical protein